MKPSSFFYLVNKAFEHVLYIGIVNQIKNRAHMTPLNQLNKKKDKEMNVTN